MSTESYQMSSLHLHRIQNTNGPGNNIPDQSPPAVSQTPAVHRYVIHPASTRAGSLLMVSACPEFSGGMETSALFNARTISRQKDKTRCRWMNYHTR